MAQSHYVSHCLNNVNWILRKKMQWNLNKNANIFFEECIFENVACEMLFISSQPQYVTSLYLVTYWVEYNRNICKAHAFKKGRLVFYWTCALHVKLEFLQNIFCWPDWYDPLQAWIPFIVPWIDMESYSYMLCLEWELLQWLKPLGLSHCGCIDMMRPWHENFFCITVSMLLPICEGNQKVTGGFF